MLDKEYAVNMLTALVDAAEEMNRNGIKAKCLAVNDAVFDTIRGLITYLQNSEEVVRCKDCIHGIPESFDTVTMKSSDELYCYRHHMGHFEDYYCADGKRKETDV